MKIQYQSAVLTLIGSLLCIPIILASPAAAVTIFADGFNDGTLCSWGPSGCTALALVDTSAEAPVNGHEEWADYQVEFTLHAGGRDLWFEKEAGRSASPTLEKGFWFNIENASGVTYTGGITPFWLSANCPYPQPCADTGSHFKVLANTTRTFWLIVRLDNVGATEGSYRMRMTGLSHKFDGNNGDGVTLVTAIPSSFVTPARFVDDQDTGNLGVDASSYEDFHQSNSQ